MDLSHAKCIFIILILRLPFTVKKYLFLIPALATDLLLVYKVHSKTLQWSLPSTNMCIYFLNIKYISKQNIFKFYFLCCLSSIFLVNSGLESLSQVPLEKIKKRSSNCLDSMDWTKGKSGSLTTLLWVQWYHQQENIGNITDITTK